MHLLVDLVAGVVLAGAGGAGSVALLMRRRLHRSTRLAPGVSASVPMRWRWSVRRAAVLHRRLQRSCQIVLASTGGPEAYRRPSRWRRRRAGTLDASMLQTTGRALLDHAVALDLRLVAVDRGGPAWRRLHLPGLAAEVATVESSALRLAQLAKALDEEVGAAAGTPAGERPELLLDAMEATIADLRRLTSPATAPTAQETNAGRPGR